MISPFETLPPARAAYRAAGRGRRCQSRKRRLPKGGERGPASVERAFRTLAALGSTQSLRDGELFRPSRLERRCVPAKACKKSRHRTFRSAASRVSRPPAKRQRSLPGVPSRTLARAAAARGASAARLRPAGDGAAPVPALTEEPSTRSSSAVGRSRWRALIDGRSARIAPWGGLRRLEPGSRLGRDPRRSPLSRETRVRGP